MTRAERDKLREVVNTWWRVSCHCEVCTSRTVAVVKAVPALLDQVDELERGYQCHFESQRALFDEVAALKAENERLLASVAHLTESAGDDSCADYEVRATRAEAERDELRFRLTKQQEAREVVEAERDALRQEVERLRQTCDIRGANWERDAAELDQARARVAELERLLIIADAASAILRTQVIDLRGVREQDVAYMARLEAALRKYGRHRRALPHPCMYPDGDCTCGLDAALAGGG